MKNIEVDEEKLKNGDYCRKAHPGCFCNVGWPKERRCQVCRYGEGCGLVDPESDDYTDHCHTGGFCDESKK